MDSLKHSPPCNPQRHFTYTNFKANYIQPDVTRGCLPRPWRRWHLVMELFLIIFFNQTRKNVQMLKRLFINSSCGHLPTSNSANHINAMGLSPPMECISSSSPPSMLPHSYPYPSQQNSFFVIRNCCNEYCLHRTLPFVVLCLKLC